jgi:subtilisin-like proprotein convertase family protein
MNLLIVKVFNNSGSWVTGQSNLASAAQWCRDQGANVISMSLSGGYSGTEDAVFQSLYDTNGILSVAAAGNDGDASNAYPANYDSVISVGAVDASSVHAEFSQFPPTSNDPNNPPANTEWDVVELCAGGVNVLSTVPLPDGSVPVYEVEVDSTTYSGLHIDESGLGTVSATLVSGGLCDSGDFDPSWSGNVVLCERGAISFADKINNVGNNGGLVALIYNNAPGNFLGTCGGNCTTGIPGLSLAQVDGQFLQADKLGFTADVTADDGSGCVGCTGGYAYYNGTSMATPGVAAGVAWVWDTCGGSSGITNKQLRQLLRDSAKDLSGTSPATTGGPYGPGYDAYTGFGLIQLNDAFELGRQRFGSTCAIAFSVDPPAQTVCTASTTWADFAIELGSDFVGTTDMTTVSAPSGSSTTFVPSSVISPSTTSTLTLGNLGAVADGTYDFSVHAEDDSDPSNAADVRATVTVVSAVPSAPTLSSPSNGAVGQSVEVTLEWNPTVGAVSYSVQIATTQDFAAPVESASGLTTTSYSVMGLDPNTTYFWRVWATNGCGGGVYSDVYSFTTQVTYCTSPGVSIPDNNPSGVDSVIVISESGTISDLDLSLEIDHSWIGDLEVTLSHTPTGPVTLIDRPGVPASTWGCNETEIIAILDDEGTLGSIEDACPPTTGGRYTPISALSAFDGTNVNGTWTLNVVDAANGETGQLVEWCLYPTTSDPCATNGIFCDGFESGDTSAWSQEVP